ncbi:MAG: tetratricopeptide repeat protein, partial [Chitinophagaceae bacterium]|nr:tetratricopeptide repeat protein [Chitinophagaceae bacterium]
MLRFFTQLFVWAFLSVFAVAQNTEALNESFLKYFNAGDYKAALPFALKSVEQSAKEFGKNDVNYAVSCQNVGVTYNKLEQWSSSSPWLFEAIRAFAEFAQTRELVEVNVCFNLIATNHLNEGNYDSSRAYYVEAYNYFLQYPADQYESLIAVSQNLCELSFTMGNYDDIISITQTLDSLIKSTEGIKSENYYLNLINNAGAYRQKPEFLRALEVYRSAELVCIDLYGKEHNEYADLLQLQSECLRNLGSMEEAEGLLKRCGIIFSRNPNTDPYTLANFQNNLGNFYGEVAQFSKAISHYDTALHLLEKQKMQDHYLYGQILKSKTYTCMDAAMYPESLDLLSTTEKWFDKKYRGKNPFYAELMVAKGNLQFFYGQLNAATQSIELAEGHLSGSGDSTSYLYSRCFEIKALIEHGKGNSREAIGLCRKAIDINNRTFGDS